MPRIANDTRRVLPAVSVSPARRPWRPRSAAVAAFLGVALLGPPLLPRGVVMQTEANGQTPTTAATGGGRYMKTGGPPLAGYVEAGHGPADDGTSAAKRPSFRVRASIPSVAYRNVCGSKSQLPILEQNGQGIGVIDFDGDGLVDLFVPNGSTESRWRKGQNPGCQLFKNLGGWRFEDVTERAGVRGEAWSCGVAIADYDADGDFDIYVLNWGPNVLYRNDGGGKFTDVTAQAGVGDPRWSSSAAFADFNGDGHLDIYVSNYVSFNYDDYPTTEKDGGECLYRGIKTGCGPWCYEGQRDTLYINVGQGRFADRSEAAGLNCTEGYRGFGVVAADLDADGDVDVYAGCDVMPNLYLENVGRARFRSVGVEKGGAFNVSGQHESGMGVAAADFDRSGTLDLFSTNFSGEKNTFYRNEGGQLSDLSAAIRFDQHRLEMGWGVCVQDFDQDGRLDVFVANGHIYPQVRQLADPDDRYAVPPRFYVQNSQGSLREIETTKAFGENLSLSLRGCASADLDNDGDLDVVAIQHNGPLVFFENLSNGPSMMLELIGADGGKSPMGAKVSISDRGTHWLLPNQGYQSTNDHRMHIAIPNAEGEIQLNVLWPHGSHERFTVDPNLTRVIRLQQGTSHRQTPSTKPRG